MPIDKVGVKKAPPMWYGDSDPQPPENKDFTMLQTMDWGLSPDAFQQTWESDDGIARGIASPNHNDGTWGISHFEVADAAQGHGHGQRYLQQFIDELRDDEYPYEDEEILEPYQIHVTQVEPSALGFWDKMVDRGVIHGAHETAWVRENVEGTHHYTHAYDRDKLVAKSTEPLYGSSSSGRLMNPFEQSFLLIKSENFVDMLIKMGRMDDAMQMQGMRQFVLENQNSSDPAMRDAAEEMYEYLTNLMSYSGGDKSGESPQMPPVAGYNAPSPEPPRPMIQDSAEAAKQPNVPVEQGPAEHPELAKSAMELAWDSIQKKMRNSGGAVQLAGYPQSREYGDSPAGASLPPRQTTRHEMMREMEQGEKDGLSEEEESDEEFNEGLNHKNKNALAEMMGMKPKGRTIGDVM
tara:strand:- start:24390 stop:25610 length:1221 start_codon:yes stop_codon:yes gene_type:complete